MGRNGCMGSLLKSRALDNDVESDEEQVEACVLFLQGQLAEASGLQRQGQ